MAARNLARTVVEGGRTNGSKSDRRYLAREARRSWRLDADGEPYQYKRRSSYREFADRLASLNRWLLSRSGLPWSKVYSEFCTKFDRRTMKGWHLHDHLRFKVCHAGFDRSSYFYRAAHDEFCAETGTLRHFPRKRYRADRNVYPERGLRDKAFQWAAGRRVIVHGSACFWTAGVWRTPSFDPERTVPLDLSVFAQGERLTEEEREFFGTLGTALRKELTSAKP